MEFSFGGLASTPYTPYDLFESLEGDQDFVFAYLDRSQAAHSSGRTDQHGAKLFISAACRYKPSM